MEALRDITAGTIAGSAGIIVGHPLDSIKVRLQTELSSSSSSMVSMFRSIVKDGGIRMLWRGVGSPLLGAAPINAIVFSVEGSSYRYLRTHYSDYGSIFLHSLAGCIAGISQTPISSVTEFIKIQLQTNYHIHIEPTVTAKFTSKSSSSFAWRRSPDSSLQLFYSILKYYNVSTLSRGLGLTFIRDPLAYAIYFGVYDYLKLNVSRRMYETNQQKLSLSSSSSLSAVHTNSTPTIVASPLLPVTSLMVCGGIAGVASWFFLHPIDVLKSIQQGLPLHTSLKEQSLRSILTSHYQRYGLTFLFRGILATCIRAFPCSAVTFPIFEWMIYLLDPLVNRSNTWLVTTTTNSSSSNNNAVVSSVLVSSNDTTEPYLSSTGNTSNNHIDDLEMESVAGGSV